jgi:NAD(P)-dependent dehydrogenase (short-subunit alcohol dehydrogenase family)
MIADRDAEGASAVAESIGGRAATIDVREREAVRELIDGVVRDQGRIDLLFNNAGIAVAGEVKDTPPSSWDAIIDVNLRGVIHGIDAAYPHMRAQRSGHIVNTASIAGLLPCPGLVAYSASKHAVVGLSRGLRAEAASYGVEVSVVCPGFVKTGIADNMTLHGLTREEAQKNVPWTDVDDCAREILDGVRKKREVIVVTRHGRHLARLARLAPAASSWIARWGRRRR